MTAGIQRLFAAIGESGCFALCIVEAGQPGCPPHTAVDMVIRGQVLKYLDADMTVRKQELFMEMCAGGEWNYRPEKATYIPLPSEISIEKWAYTHPKSGYHEHFAWRRQDGTLWDSLGNSETLKQGKCIDKRIFRRIV